MSAGVDDHAGGLGVADDTQLLLVRFVEAVDLLEKVPLPFNLNFGFDQVHLPEVEGRLEIGEEFLLWALKT